MKMSIEDFKQLVLLMIIDVQVDDGYHWMCIDDDGALFVYTEEPVANNNKGWWDTEAIGRSYRIHPPSRKIWQDIVSLPDNISWRDCKWKI